MRRHAPTALSAAAWLTRLQPLPNARFGAVESLARAFAFEKR